MTSPRDHFTQLSDADLAEALRLLDDAKQMRIDLEMFHQERGWVASSVAQKQFDRIRELEAEVAEVSKKVYQPGVFRCAKCGFSLVQSTLNASTGSVTASVTAQSRRAMLEGSE